MSLPGLLYLGLAMIGIAGLVASRRRRKPETIVIFAVAAVLPLICNRHYPQFALALIAMAGEHIADVWNSWWPQKWSRASRSHWTWAGSNLVSLVLLVLSLSRILG
jgi:LPXTG-motif cell wall-anchored protein